MKNLGIGLTLLITAGLMLAPGCGDDDDSDTTGGTSGAGAGGKAGASGGTSSGGTSSGGKAGASGGTSSGGTSSAGTSSGGTSAAGAPGAGGAGGAGFMNPAGCPDTAPDTTDPCSVDLDIQTSCEYPGSRCVCNGYLGAGGVGGANAGTWICQGDGTDCPDPAPATDDACTDNGQNCPYPGGVNCFCTGNSWSCDDPAQGVGGAGNTPGECPPDLPDEEMACQGGIYGCLYEDDNAVCNCPGAGQDPDQWHCETF